MALPKRLRAYLARHDVSRRNEDIYRVLKRRKTKKQALDKRHRCRECGHPTKRKQQPEPAPCRLLALPAELRNRIYEYTLANDTPPHIMARNLNRQPPPWLLTCKQIYNEAVKIWFYVNQKHTIIEIEDLDARAFIHWTKRRQQLKVPFDDPPVYCRTSYNWKNLMAWCKAVWEAKGFWELSPSNGGLWAQETNMVVWSALELAADYHDLPWVECEQALGSLRNALSVYERRWGGYIGNLL